MPILAVACVRALEAGAELSDTLPGRRAVLHGEIVATCRTERLEHMVHPCGTATRSSA